jgi:hypothetical protein
MKRWLLVAFAAALATALAGCGDAIHRMVANQTTRTQLLDQIAADTSLTAATVDRLMASDPSRSVVIRRFLDNGEARQALLARVGQDRTFVDGMIHYAAQDSGMREHVMTLVRGMQMGSEPARSKP